MKANHHFVPRFYLKAFESARRRTNLYNLNRNLAVENASIADQCCGRKFYGADDTVEDALADFEQEASRIIRLIVATEAIPSETSDWVGLYTFVALQTLRTSAAAARANQVIAKMANHIISTSPQLSAPDLAALSATRPYPVYLPLSSAIYVAQALATLEMHLVISERGDFLTSDNPVFQYNQYCEGLRDASASAPGRAGFQLFLPLSPRLQLAMFDSEVYRVPRSIARRTARSVATERDVNALNEMQLVGAEKQVFFSNWNRRESVMQLAKRASAKRVTDPVQVEEFVQDDDPSSSLLRVFSRTPLLKLDLSFLQATRSARQVPLLERFRKFRSTIPMTDTSEPTRPQRQGPVRFSRRADRG